MRPDNGLLHLYFSTNGRINRQTFWLHGIIVYWIIWSAIWFGAWIIAVQQVGICIYREVLGSDSLSELIINSVVGIFNNPGCVLERVAWLALLMGVLQLLMLWTLIAIVAKRLHDRDKSGWFMLLWPVTWVFVSLFFFLFIWFFSFVLAYMIIGVWMFIELGCLEGTPGPNRHGEDPSPRPWLQRGYHDPYSSGRPYQDYVNCPSCAEPVRPGAMMCRYCRADLRIAPPTPPYPPPAQARSAPVPSPMAFPQLALPTGQVFTITGPVRIGRGEEAEITLGDPNVSRIHAVVTGAPGSLTIEDNASTNGTYVNGFQVQSATLNVGDRIQVGSTEISVSF